MPTRIYGYDKGTGIMYTNLTVQCRTKPVHPKGRCTDHGNECCIHGEYDGGNCCRCGTRYVLLQPED